jgi:selenocysteine lyase/cysteine desulfurase
VPACTEVEVVRSALFEPEEFLFKLELALKRGADAAVLTHASNVFGYILPIERADALCARYNVPLVIDASQTAGSVPLDLSGLHAVKFVCMPGHKGLLGPQGTGILICAAGYGEPLMFGGTGADSRAEGMPDYLPERLEAGTQNVHGIAGLREGIRFIRRIGVTRILEHERSLVDTAAKALDGTVLIKPYKAEHLFCQNGVLSVSIRDMPSENAAQLLSEKGVAVRAGLHCAPLAHETAGTLENGTLRMSMSWYNTQSETERAAMLLRSIVTGVK